MPYTIYMESKDIYCLLFRTPCEGTVLWTTGWSTWGPTGNTFGAVRQTGTKSSSKSSKLPIIYGMWDGRLCKSFYNSRESSYLRLIFTQHTTWPLLKDSKDIDGPISFALHMTHPILYAPPQKKREKFVHPNGSSNLSPPSRVVQFGSPVICRPQSRK